MYKNSANNIIIIIICNMYALYVLLLVEDVDS